MNIAQTRNREIILVVRFWTPKSSTAIFIDGHRSAIIMSLWNIMSKKDKLSPVVIIAIAITALGIIYALIGMLQH